MSRTLRVCLVVLPLLLAACWPAPGGGPDRRGHNRFETAVDTDTIGELEHLWTADLGRVESEPVLSGGRLYVHNGATLFGLEAATGEEVWSVDVSEVSEVVGARFHGPVITDRGRVAAASAGADGRFPVARWFDASNGELTGGSTDGYLSSLRRPYGAFANRVQDPQLGDFTFLKVVDLDDSSSWSGLVSSTATEVTVGRDLVFHTDWGLNATDPVDVDDFGNGVRAFPLTGARTDCLGVAACPVWALELPGEETFPPLLSSDGATLFAVVVGGAGVHALDAASGDLLWTSSVAVNATAPPALADGLLYVPGSLGFTYVFDAEGCGEATCEHLWLARTGQMHDSISTRPTVVGEGETAVLFTTSETYGAVDAYPAGGCEGPQACTPVWSGSTATPTTSAVVSNGRLYVGSEDGLVAYGLP